MLKKRFESGLSMIEVLMITAIIGILMVIALTSLPQQLTKARDGQRKSDLQKIKIAFENYYSDNDCYPPPEILDNCGGAELSPYLSSIPCDPLDQSKYLYAPVGDSCSSAYRIFSNLEVDTDPVIEELGCHTDVGCGAFAFFEDELGELAIEYNYGVSEGVQLYVTEGGLPVGTSGFCCQNYGGNCDAYTYGNGICQNFYLHNDECDTACGAPD